jgi:hypothetical protein
MTSDSITSNSCLSSRLDDINHLLTAIVYMLLEHTTQCSAENSEVSTNLRTAEQTAEPAAVV